jgi:hypothetical protein
MKENDERFAMSFGTKTPMKTPRRDASNRSPRRQSSPPASMTSRANKLGSAKASHDRYVVLAHAAASAGDQIEAENLFQHAEHYFRMMRQGADRHSVLSDEFGAVTISA